MDLSWLFTVPVLKQAIMIAVILAALFLVVQVLRWSIQSKCPNPFGGDIRVPRKPYIHDQKKRDAVIKQGFSKDKIPEGSRFALEKYKVCDLLHPDQWATK